MQEALALIGAGLPVFPCSEKKQPVGAGGSKAATLDRQQVIAWWTKKGAARIGVRTGTIVIAQGQNPSTATATSKRRAAALLWDMQAQLSAAGVGHATIYILMGVA